MAGKLSLLEIATRIGRTTAATAVEASELRIAILAAFSLAMSSSVQARLLSGMRDPPVFHVELGPERVWLAADTSICCFHRHQLRLFPACDIERKRLSSSSDQRLL
jgi:hypothetical protein